MGTRAAGRRWPSVGSPRFRRDPFVRDGVFDLGRASAPRITVPHMLPSATLKASASAICFRGSITHPAGLLCTLRRGRCLPQRNTHYQAGATPYLGRTFAGWISPASWRTSVSVWWFCSHELNDVLKECTSESPTLQNNCDYLPGWIEKKLRPERLPSRQQPPHPELFPPRP